MYSHAQWVNTARVVLDGTENTLYSVKLLLGEAALFSVWLTVEFNLMSSDYVKAENCIWAICYT